MLISVFQTATFPPELWRECMRWATLPPYSGRLPLDDPCTLLDPWPVGIPDIPFPYLRPETAYGFEQRCLYPTKRALMLVSKTWAELAVEFMYESLVIDQFGVGRLVQVVAALEGPAGFLLKRWVKRVDIWFEDQVARDHACERLARIGLPNLRVQYLFLNQHLTVVPSAILLSEQPLHLVEPSGSPIFDRLMSRGGAFGGLRCLTLPVAQPLSIPFLLPSNLRRLTIIVYVTANLRVQDFFSTRDSVALPNLTHLILHHIDIASDRFMRSMDLINRVGPQLRHLTLTAINMARDWTGVDLCTILGVCTRLTELVISSHVSIREADPSGYRHSILQILGIPMTPGACERDYRSFFDIFSRRESFPELGTMRVIPISANPGEMEANQWLEQYALRLRGHGIRLEDYLGRHLLPVPVPENQNQQPLSGCMDAAS